MVKRGRTWREGLKDLLHMHRGERRGMLVLLGICVMAMAWVTWEQWLRPQVVTDQDRVEALWATLPGPDEADTGRAASRAPVAVELFDFDPNTNTMDQWVRLGLSERQAASMMRYIAHGGTFRSKQDLAKMRVLSPELFARWEPHIQLPDRSEREPFAHRAEGPWSARDSAVEHVPYKSAESRKMPERLEINGADSLALVALPGIGPAFARAIMRYRDRLGGFVDLDQLNEVHILQDKPDAVVRIRRMLVLDPASVHRLPINTCTAEEMGRHPYVGWKLAKVLVNYRTAHGPFADLQAIKGCVLVNDSLLQRLAPYIELK